jgi:uncharacterized protein with PQ loop repeat
MGLQGVALASGYTGAGLGVVMVVPQIARTLRDRTMPGVSALSWALTALACTAWLLYGVRTGEIPQIPGNVLLVTGAVLIVLVVPSTASTVARAFGLVVAGSVIGGLAVVLPPPLIGLLGFAIGLVSGLPQIAQTLARNRAESSAVSLLAWWLRAGSQACWLGYALVLHDVTVLVSAAFLLTSALVVVAGELARRPAPAEAVCVV